jgi:hypothetical protein
MQSHHPEHRDRRAPAPRQEPARQLDQLRGLLAIPAVQSVVADAAARDTAVSTAADTLRSAAAARPRPPRTPKETEKLDLLDGYLIELVRAARAAARAEARVSGQESIAKAFELTALYRGTARGKAEPPAPTT